MAESKLQYIVSAVIALAVTVGVPLLVNSKQAVREKEDSSLADMVSASLNGYMDGDDWSKVWKEKLGDFIRGCKELAEGLNINIGHERSERER